MYLNYSNKGVTVLYGYAVVLLDDIHHKGTLDGAEVLNLPQNVKKELLIVLHVGSLNF